MSKEPYEEKKKKYQIKKKFYCGDVWNFSIYFFLHTFEQDTCLLT